MYLRNSIWRCGGMIALIFILLNISTQAQTLIYSQNFDTAWTTPGTTGCSGWSDGGYTGDQQWHQNAYTTGWTNASSGAYSPTGAISTTNSARYHSVGVYSGLPGALITPQLDFSSYSGSKRLLFYYINTDGNDSLEIYLSTNDGATWGSRLRAFNHTFSWERFSVDLGTTTSSTVKIKFVAYSDRGTSSTTDIGLDQVEIYGSLTPISGLKTIPGDYATITSAMDAMQKNTISGPVIFELSSGYSSSGETFPVVLSNVPNASAVNTVTFRPAAGATPVLSNKLSTAVLQLNNAQYITLDGRQEGASNPKSWIIQNSNILSSAYTIQFLGSSTYNTLQYLDIRGACQQTATEFDGGTGYTGVVFFGQSWGTTSGNSNNTIQYCDLRNASSTDTDSLAVTLIGSYSQTTSYGWNNYNVIRNNNFYNWSSIVTSTSSYSQAIMIYNSSTGWTIRSNSFYQPISRSYAGTMGTYMYAITLAYGDHTVDSNYIGGRSALCGGSPMTLTTTTSSVSLYGIFVQFVTGTNPTLVTNNTIKNIAVTTMMANSGEDGTIVGIYYSPNSAYTVTITGNTIGSATDTSSIRLTSLSAPSGPIPRFVGVVCKSSGTVNISNNTIAGITTDASDASKLCAFRGISCPGNGSTIASLTISNNTIGSLTVPYSIKLASPLNGSAGSFTQEFVGIRSTCSGIVSGTISNNTICNVHNAGNVYSPVSGMTFNGGAITVSSNLIRKLSTYSANSSTSISSAALMGFANSYNGAVNFTGNKIDSLISYRAYASSIIGISNASSGIGGAVQIFQKNSLNAFLLSNSSDSSNVLGIYCASSAPAQFQNNYIHLGVDSGVVSSPYSYYGIYETNAASNPSTSSFYFNTVYLGGTASGTKNSYAFFSGATTYATSTLRTIKNNILYNARTGGTGFHYAIKFSGSGINPTGVQNNFNLYGTGPVASPAFLAAYGAVDCSSLASWKSTFGQDWNSVTGNPNFVNPDGYALYDLHINTSGTTPIEANGGEISGIADDYYGNARSSMTPTDIGAEAGNFSGSDITPPAISFTALTSSASLATRTVTGISITDNSGVNTTSGTLPRIYYKKSTDTDTLIGNTSTDNGWKWVEASNASSPFAFTIDYSLLNGGSVAVGNTIQYFITAQDLSGTPQVGQSSGVFAATPSSVNLTTANFPVGSSVNSYSIANGFSGSYNVGTSQTYATLTGASGFFSAVNAGVVTGNVTVNIVSDITETGANSLLQWAEEGVGNYTMTIQPDAATVRTLSASGLSVPMIKFDGADRVTIDGRFGGSGKYLRFLNTHATVGSCQSTIQFVNGATNCVVQYDSIECNTQATSQACILIGASTNTASCSVSINNCEIKEANNTSTVGTPYHGIYSISTSTIANLVTVADCNIYNFYLYGVRITGAAAGSSVTGCNFYNNLGTVPAIVSQTAILVSQPTSNLQSGYVISNNYIGGSAPNCGGTNPYQIQATTGTAALTGISVTCAAANPATSIQNNVIKRIYIPVIGATTRTTTFTGISTTGNVNIGTTAGNTIGDNSTANSVRITGTGNLTAITCSGSTSIVDIENNTIANLTNNTTFTNTATFVGINGPGNLTVKNNSVHDILMTTNSTSTTGYYGIQASAGIAGQVEGNTIYNLTLNPVTAATATSIQGIVLSGGPMSVKRNVVYNLNNTATSAAASLYGIRMASGSSTTEIVNNMISLGSYSGGSVANNLLIYGIYESCTSNATLSYYHNTVRISGTVTSGSDTTYAFMRAQPTGYPASFSMKNNIFENARTGGTGKHLAVSNNSTFGTNWSSNYQNYNIENAADPSAVGQWLMGQPVLNFSNWKTNSNVDPNSKSGITLYFNPVDMSNGIYHLTGASLGDKNLTGTPLGTVLTDFDGQLRHPIYPYIGADEDTTARLFILINFHAFLEGLMNQTNTAMTPDTVTLKLCLGSAPFTVVDSATGMLDANGNGTFYFRGSSYIDSAYYVVLTHRNSIQTWTASPNSFLNSTLTFDLASSATQAYGNNLIQRGSYYCVYTGDVNQDGFVDFSDLAGIDNDSYNYTTGYVVTDLNGDDFVDFTDLAMCDNNSYNYIGIAAPGFAKVHYTRPAKHYTPIAR